MFLLANTGIELAKFRRRHPADDLMTAIVDAEVDGHRLTDEEIGAFLILLASAGNDTTKQTTSHAMLALAANPGQREWLTADFENRIGPAVEEFIRWATPVLQFARTVTEDTELAGQQLSAGDKVGLFYCSANRDDNAFDRPQMFNLQRKPNPHLGFGGGGPHFCLGNQLARTELRNLFRELLSRVDVEFGEPEYLMSNFVTASSGSRHASGEGTVTPCALTSILPSAPVTASARPSPRTSSRSPTGQGPHPRQPAT